jgi:hypothetical protein
MSYVVGMAGMACIGTHGKLAWVVGDLPPYLLSYCLLPFGYLFTGVSIDRYLPTYIPTWHGAVLYGVLLGRYLIIHIHSKESGYILHSSWRARQARQARPARQGRKEGRKEGCESETCYPFLGS